MFNRLHVLMLLKLIFVASAWTMPAAATPKTVSSVDLNKYLGRWYEIASIPQWFSQGCHCTTAEYSKRQDGRINVVNSCKQDSINGKPNVANGIARVDDKKSNAKLSVNFFGPFWGEYWIIGLDKNYRYAVVSNSDASSLWILSRTPVLSPDLYSEAMNIAQKNGVKTNSIQKTVQKGCKY